MNSQLKLSICQASLVSRLHTVRTLDSRNPVPVKRLNADPFIKLKIHRPPPLFALHPSHLPQQISQPSAIFSFRRLTNPVKSPFKLNNRSACLPKIYLILKMPIALPTTESPAPPANHDNRSCLARLRARFFPTLDFSSTPGRSVAAILVIRCIYNVMFFALSLVGGRIGVEIIATLLLLFDPLIMAFFLGLIAEAQGERKILGAWIVSSPRGFDGFGDADKHDVNRDARTLMRFS